MNIDATTYESRQYAEGGRLAAWLILLWTLATMSLWFFAFYDVPSDAPDWVRRAQLVCFGKNESGLPAAEGWMVLVLSPALFLTALFLGMGDEILSFFRHLRDNRTIRVCAVALVVVIFIQMGWVARTIQNRILTYASVSQVVTKELLPPDYPIGATQAPEFSLIDQSGNEISLSSFRGSPLLLTYVFAHCTAVCPALVKTVAQATEQIGPAYVHALLVTLDPWRDTPQALPGLSKKWELGAGISLLSGSPERVEEVLSAYQVPRERDEKTGDVAHPALVHVISPQGKIAYTFNNPSVPWLIEAVKRISQ